jgi:hypothetical protein
MNGAQSAWWVSRKSFPLLLDDVAFSILLRRVGGKPGLLVLDEVFGVFAEVADGLERELTGDVVGVVVGWGLDDGGPAVDGAEELWQGLADVAVAGAVLVQVVFEVVSDGRELLEHVMDVLLAAGAAGARGQFADRLRALIHEPDEGQDALVGEAIGVTEFFDFFLRQWVFGALKARV